MAESAPCPTCGAANPPDDDFCGACGAPLAVPGTTAAVGGSAAAGNPDPVAVALVRCPACGIANDAARTFCQYCGRKLPADARAPIGRPSASVASPSPAAVSAPQPPSPAAAGPLPQPKPAPAPRPAAGGFATWILAVVLLGLLTGAVIVGASVFLREGAPEPIGGARTAPPSAPAPTTSPSVSSADAAP